MVILILLMIFFGLTCGLLSGITPGLHLNLVSVVAVSVLPAFGLEFLYVFVFVMSVAVTHTIVDILASTYLGVPDEQTIAGLLPAQKLVMNGRAHEAIFFTIVGSVLSVFACVILLFVIYFLLSFFEIVIEPFLGICLIFILFFLLWQEKNRFLCFCLFVLSGIFGVFVLTQESMVQPLLPLLGGLFGGSGLLETIRKKVVIPKQIDCLVDEKIPFGAVFASTVTGIVAAFMPGVGSSQAAIIAGRFVGQKPLTFQLVLAGGINTVNMVFSIATWFALGKSRNGAVASISSLGEPTIYVGALLVLICCVIAPLSGIITLYSSRFISKVFCKVNYPLLAIFILCFIVGLIFWFDGFLGLVVFIGATALGSFCMILGLPKHYLMGCLLMPVIVYFLQ